MEEFSTHINSIHPDIKFTREEEDDEKCLPMLNVKTQRGDDGRLSFAVYRKPDHRDQYLQFDSNQPLQHKLGVIRTLHHRAQILCTTEEAKINEIEHLQRVLSISGYTKSAWVTATNQVRGLLCKIQIIFQTTVHIETKTPIIICKKEF